MPDKQDEKITQIIQPNSPARVERRGAVPGDSLATDLPPPPKPAERVDTRVLIPGAETGQAEADLTTGWLVIVTGPGRGKSFALGHAKNSVGRGDDQTVTLDFGDGGISRDKAALIVYDHLEQAFHLIDQGATNNIYLNDALVVGAVRLARGDRIRISETTLMLVPLCGPDFDWQDKT